MEEMHEHLLHVPPVILLVQDVHMPRIVNLCAFLRVQGWAGLDQDQELATLLCEICSVQLGKCRFSRSEPLPLPQERSEEQRNTKGHKATKPRNSMPEIITLQKHLRRSHRAIDLRQAVIVQVRPFILA